MNNIDIYHQLGKRIAYLRKQRKMSSLTLALEGKRNPSLKVLRKIAIALDIDLSELFVGIRDYLLSSEYK